MAKTTINPNETIRFQLSLLRLTQQANMTGAVRPGQANAVAQLTELVGKAPSKRR